jgi:putative tryptophan/tyrosine transport system substrate-binding protein
MKRREFISLVGVALAEWPFPSLAQQPVIPVIGFINAATAQGYARPLRAFLNGLAEAGYLEGRNVAIEYRWASGYYDQLPSFVADLIQRKVKVIAATSTPAAIAAKTAATTIPVVFTTSGDPVKLGLVTAINRPGGNFTGASQLNVEVAPKRLELIHQLLPYAKNIGLLVNPTNPLAEPVTKDLASAAEGLGLKLHVVRAATVPDLATAFASLVEAKAEALVIGTDVFFNSYSDALARTALEHHLPAIYQYPEFAAAGGLISYGGDVAESYRLAGIDVGRILKGERPGDLPVEEVTKVELIINLKTAKALGVTFPLSLLGRADEVIE